MRQYAECFLGLGHPNQTVRFAADKSTCLMKTQIKNVPLYAPIPPFVKPYLSGPAVVLALPAKA
jgi:hypothetical protein